MLTFTRLFDCKSSQRTGKRDKVYPRYVKFADTKLESRFGVTEVAVTAPAWRNDRVKIYPNVIVSHCGTCIVATYDTSPSIVKCFPCKLWPKDYPQYRFIEGFSTRSSYKRKTGEWVLGDYEHNAMLVRNWLEWVENFDLYDERLWYAIGHSDYCQTFLV